MSLPLFLEGIQISEGDWGQTPPAVQQLIIVQFHLIQSLQRQVEELLAKLGQNSNRPPSSDMPYQKAKRESKGKGKPGAIKGHKGHQQQLLEPAKVVPVPPKECVCGNHEFSHERA